MNIMKENIAGLEMTGEEFIAAYREAPPENRREIRRLLAEDRYNKGDYEGAARLLSMKD